MSVFLSFVLVVLGGSFSAYLSRMFVDYPTWYLSFYFGSVLGVYIIKCTTMVFTLDVGSCVALHATIVISVMLLGAKLRRRQRQRQHQRQHEMSK